MKLEEESSTENIIPFTFDFDALYDSLTPELVLEALEHAMVNTTTWSKEFRDWLLQLVKLSLTSAAGMFRDQWYLQIFGIPTGGSLSVQLANIAVHYAMRHVVFEKLEMMKNIVALKRFIDDGVGIFLGSLEELKLWQDKVSNDLKLFGLKIKPTDWNTATSDNSKMNFLDISFWFENKTLQTDLYVKPTDSRSYLNFRSSHPHHTFKGIVYSQALRLRRIINDEERLKVRLSELMDDFKKCEYPTKMLSDISNKVAKMDRILKTPKVPEKPDEDDSILVISTYGADKPLLDIIEKIPHKDQLKLKYIKKTGSSLKSRLCKSKSIGTGYHRAATTPCKRSRCKSCKLISPNKDHVTSNGVKYSSCSGTCITRNVIYAAQCSICKKLYAGKTTDTLAGRINGHRAKTVEYFRKGGNVRTSGNDEEYTLARHAYNHGQNLDDLFKFCILEHVSPSNMHVKEHLWIQKLRTIAPLGINSVDPFGISLLK